MGIISSISDFRNGEQKHQEQAEGRERDFVKQRDVMQYGLADDLAYTQQVEHRNDLIKWQQDLDDEMQEIVYNLLGINEMDGELVQRKKPLCNEKFVYDVVIPQCKPFMSRSLINTNWSEDQILISLKNTANTIVAQMADNYERYGIEFSDMSSILTAIKNHNKAGAYRSWNGWTKRMDSTMIKRVESHNDSGTTMKRKTFGGFVS